MAYGPMHACPEDGATSGFGLHSFCEDGSVGASDIFILIAAVVVMAAVGFVIYNWIKRRFSE